MSDADRIKHQAHRCQAPASHRLGPTSGVGMRLGCVFLFITGACSLACGGLPVKDTATALPGLQIPAAPATHPASAPTVLDDDILVAGTRGASITVIQYSDWQCGHCERAYPQVLAAVGDHPDVALHFRTFPLTQVSCLPGATDDKCTLAAAALCADDAGEFSRFAPLAFADPLSMLAEVTSDKTSAMHACVTATATLQRVAGHKAAAQMDGVMGTPTLFVSKDDQWVELHPDDLAIYLAELTGDLPAEMAE